MPAVVIASLSAYSYLAYKLSILMKLKFLPLAFIALMWACGDDDHVEPETPNNPDPETPETPVVRKMSFQMYDVVAGEFDNWIILSDDKGAILDYKKLEDNATYTFETEFDADVINLTLVYNELVQVGSEDAGWRDVKRTLISTYTDVPFGAYGNSPWNTITRKQLGYVDVEGFQQNDDYFKFQVSTPQLGSVSYEYEQYDKARIHLSDTTDKSAIMIMSLTAPYTYLYTEIGENDSHVRSLEDFQSANVREAYLPDGMTAVQATMFGENKYGVFTYYVRNMEVKSGTMSVPYARDVFNAYHGTYSGSLQGDRYAYYFSGLSTPPATMWMLDATLEYAFEGDTLSWKAKGSIDAARIRAYAVGSFPDGDAVYWDVFGGTNKRVTPPAIPDEITLAGATEGVYKTFQDLAEGRAMQTEIIDGVDFNGYTEYIVGRYLKTGTRPKITGYRSRQGK